MNAIKTSSVIALALLCALGGAPAAHAASIYDNAYRTINEVHVEDVDAGVPCANTDLSLNWQEYITEPSKWQFGSVTWAPLYKTSFENAVENGRWGVSQVQASTGDYIVVFWTEDASLGLAWASGAYEYVYAPNVYAVTIECAGNSGGGTNQPTMFPMNGGGPSNGTVNVEISNESSGSVSVRNYFVLTDFPSYPSGYEGADIRAEAPADAGYSVQPSYWYKVTDRELKIRDTTSNQDIDVLGIDLCIFQLPNNTFGDNFSEYIFDCHAKPEVTHVFPEHGTYTILERLYSSTRDEWFEVDQELIINGETFGTEDDLLSLDNCMIEDFPFFNVDECKAAFQDAISMLSFGTINFDTVEVADNDCGNFAVFDDWLNLPDNYEICPIFPEVIRNTVDPFLSFMLGFTAIGFITRRGFLT